MGVNSDKVKDLKEKLTYSENRNRVLEEVTASLRERLNQALARVTNLEEERSRDRANSAIEREAMARAIQVIRNADSNLRSIGL